MTIQQMRYFLVVCRLQNITHAAAELHIAQSTLSQAMQTIEDETGLNLFLRAGRTIRISQDGQKLCQKVTALLREVDAFEDGVREMSCRHGKISLAIPQQQASFLIPRLLHTFQHEHPEIQLDIIEPYGVEAARFVQEEKVDLAVVNYDGSTLPDLQYRRIDSRPVKFIVWPGHPPPEHQPGRSRLGTSCPAVGGVLRHAAPHAHLRHGAHRAKCRLLLAAPLYALQPPAHPHGPQHPL